MTPDVQAAADHLRALLDDIDDHCRKAGIDPAGHRDVRVFPGFPYALTNGDLHALLAAVDQLDAAVERTVARMREYGSGSVNVRQVINLLSPTWPDGNYAAPAPHAPLTDEPCGLVTTEAGTAAVLDYKAIRREQHPHPGGGPP